MSGRVSCSTLLYYVFVLYFVLLDALYRLSRYRQNKMSTAYLFAPSRLKSLENEYFNDQQTSPTTFLRDYKYPLNNSLSSLSLSIFRLPVACLIYSFSFSPSLSPPPQLYTITLKPKKKIHLFRTRTPGKREDATKNRNRTIARARGTLFSLSQMRTR